MNIKKRYDGFGMVKVEIEDDDVVLLLEGAQRFLAEVHTNRIVVR